MNLGTINIAQILKPKDSTPARHVPTKPGVDFVASFDVVPSDPRPAERPRQAEKISDKPQETKEKCDSACDRTDIDHTDDHDAIKNTADDKNASVIDAIAEEENNANAAANNVNQLIDNSILASLVQVAQATESPAFAAAPVAQNIAPTVAVAIVSENPSATPLASNLPKAMAPNDVLANQTNAAPTADELVVASNADNSASALANDDALLIQNDADQTDSAIPQSVMDQLLKTAKSMTAAVKSDASMAPETPSPAAETALPQTPSAAGAPQSGADQNSAGDNTSAFGDKYAAPQTSSKASDNSATNGFASKFEHAVLAKEPAVAQSTPAQNQTVITPQILTAQNNNIVNSAKNAPTQISTGNVAIEQVKFHIVKSIKDGVDSIKIHLSPEDLGRVDIRLDMHKDGSVKAVIAADKPETAVWLERDAKHLERALQDAGLKADSNSLQFENRGGQNSNAFAAMQDHNAHSGKYSAHAKYATVNIAIENGATTTNNIYAANSGVNILV